MSSISLIAMGVFALLFGGCAAILYVQLRQDDRIARRVKAVRGLQQTDTAVDIAASMPRRMLGRMGFAIAKSGVLSAKTIKDLEQTLIAAGLDSRSGLGLFIGCKLVMAIGLPLMVWLLLDWMHIAGFKHTLSTVGAVVIGMMGPDWTIRWLRKRHLNAVEQGLPDALDMMVICAEAGLPLEPAINRVGREIKAAHPAVAKELLQTANEMRIVADHRLVLTQMGSRTGISGCKRLATTLVQTMQYGTPLVDALRVLAAEMRGELLTRFEARAARLPVLLTLPMIIFILPCVFLVVGGPAVVQVIHIFKG